MTPKPTQRRVARHGGQAGAKAANLIGQEHANGRLCCDG